MRIIIAPDKFKGSMTAGEAARMIAEGVAAVFPQAERLIFPLSDGGEGLLEALVGDQDQAIRALKVHGPLGNPVEARWGYIAARKTAVIETAEASGLGLIPPEERNPAKTSSYGAGELIKAALDAGSKILIVGIGGSATNDGGAGMAAALGVKFYNRRGRPLAGGGAELLKLHTIDTSGLDQRLKTIKTVVACDVDNPLTGPSGASLTYGPQKGATPEMAALLDRALKHYASIIKNELAIDLMNLKGAGAAGGLGGGLVAFLQAELKSGIDLVLDQLDLDRYLQGCSLVITGEGKLDSQTIHGKVPLGLAKRAGKFKVPVLALTGKLEADPAILRREGISASFAIADGPLTAAESMARAPQLIRNKTVELLEFWKSAGCMTDT